jgi:putative ATP-dependent endonuclease of the OLD family
MKITGIAVQRYRSIDRARRVDIGDATVLIGPNNEGKSNLLRALVTAMRLVNRFGLPTGNREVKRLRLGPHSAYSWEEDFPKHLQESGSRAKTIIDLWFALDGDEQAEFHRSIGSRLRTELPIRLSIDSQFVEFAARKQGPGAAALNRKSAQVARFVGRAVQIEYIQAVRTASRAESVVSDMVELELRELRLDEEFRGALETLTAALEPMTGRLSSELCAVLQDFLPDVAAVTIELGTDAILQALTRQVSIKIDDGVLTDIRHKGDGIQSLAALALVRKAAARRPGSLFLAIEEPEAHLHPRAVHQLRRVLDDIATNQQLVLTTHSPILAARHPVSSNVVVRAKQAAHAQSISDVRDALGVRVSDNLQHARFVVLVEGLGDVARLIPLLVARPCLNDALTGGELAVESLGSASYLLAALDRLRAQLMDYHVLLDGDDAGRQAAAKAREAGLLSGIQVNFITVPGLNEAEYEDTLDVGGYAPVIQRDFGVDLSKKDFKGRQKWSTRIRAAFHAQGKHWDKSVAGQVKARVTDWAVQTGSRAYHAKRAGCLDSFLDELERRVTEPGREVKA